MKKQIIIVSAGMMGVGVVLSAAAAMVPGDQIVLSFTGGALIGSGLVSLILILRER